MIYSGTKNSDAKNSDAKNAARGMVTVELAIGIMIVMIVAVLVAWLVSLFGAQTICNDHAAQIARAEARSDTAQSKVAQDRVPEDAEITIDRKTSVVEVKVTMEKSFGGIGSVTIEGKAVMPSEG